MIDKIKILFVEDLYSDFELAVYEIKNADIEFECKLTDNKEEYKKLLFEFKPDLIISDYIMPSFNGMLALELKKQLMPDVPLIILTGSMNESIAVECMKSGADDYVIKEHIARLPLAIKAAIENSKVRLDIKIARKEIEKREKLLRTAINNLPSIFIVYDSRKRIEYINEVGIFISGKEECQIIGQKDEDVFPDEDWEDHIHSLNRAYSEKRPQMIECSVTYAEYPHYLICYHIPLLDEHEEVYQVLGIAYDITERKLFEKELQAAREKAEESDRLKSAFLRNVSHELRTPLNAILGFTQLALKSHKENETLHSFLEIIMSSGEDLLELIKQLIDISMLQSGRKEINLSEFNLNRLIIELQESYIHKERKAKLKNIIFRTRFDNNIENKGLIRADKEKISQILKNLIKNAFKFTEKGYIETGYEIINKKEIRFYVKDTGIGIKQEMNNFIFNAFRQADESYTRPFGGIGLGLHISRVLTEQMKGKIWFESEVGKGSTFYFIAPYFTSKKQ